MIQDPLPIEIAVIARSSERKRPISTPMAISRNLTNGIRLAAESKIKL
jgi:hypothetical protein